jgi:hypothetical protein
MRKGEYMNKKEIKKFVKYWFGSTKQITIAEEHAVNMILEYEEQRKIKAIKTAKDKFGIDLS